MRAGVVGVVAVLTLVGCASEPEPTPEVLTATQAGGTYLDAVCPVNDAWGEMDLAVDKLRIAVGRGDTDSAALDALLDDAVEQLQGAMTSAIKMLGKDEHTWPTGTQDEVEDVRDALQIDAEQLEEFEKLPADEAASYAWDPGDAPEAGAAARSVLGLPDDAIEACAQWAKHGSEDSESSSGHEPSADDSSADEPSPNAPSE